MRRKTSSLRRPNPEIERPGRAFDPAPRKRFPQSFVTAPASYSTRLSNGQEKFTAFDEACDLKSRLRLHLFRASFGVRTRPRVAFRILKTFAKESSCDSKLVCARVGHTRHHITSRLAAFTSLPRQRCIENRSLIRGQNWILYATQLSSWRKATHSFYRRGLSSPITIIW